MSAALDHPNIVAVDEAGHAGPVPYIASRFCAGPTLANWLRRRTDRVPPKEAARLVATLAGAVQHAHDRGILHRDLRPSNVLLEPTSDKDGGLDGYVPSITDFGLAKVIDDLDAGTVTGDLLGTAE